MEQNKTLGKLMPQPIQRGPSPSRTFSELYQKIHSANKKYYKGHIPPEVMPLIQSYTETKYGMMFGGSIHMNDLEMVLQVGEDPVQKAQGIIFNGPGTQGPTQPIK